MKINIFAIVLLLLIGFKPAQAQQAQPLFNGNDLNNWNFVVDKNTVPSHKVFTVKDGVIHIEGTLGYMYTKEKYGNCILNVEWRWPAEATNSGIFVLIEEATNPFPNGIECQLAHGSAGDLVLLGGSDLDEFITLAGSERPKFPIITKANDSSEKPAGEWNHAKIIMDDGVITVYINDVYQNKGTNKIKSGHIGLQSEGKDIQFRNVTVTPLNK